jgi:hypothetical protein
MAKMTNQEFESIDWPGSVLGLMVQVGGQPMDGAMDAPPESVERKLPIIHMRDALWAVVQSDNPGARAWWARVFGGDRPDDLPDWLVRKAFMKLYRNRLISLYFRLIKRSQRGN